MPIQNEAHLDGTYSYPNPLFHPVKKAKSIADSQHPRLFRGVIGVVTFFLLIVRIASPFLHTHSIESQRTPTITASLHCDACDYEATQAVEPDIAIALPSIDFQYEVKVSEIQSPFRSQSHSSSESRGPPQNS